MSAKTLRENGLPRLSEIKWTANFQILSNMRNVFLRSKRKMIMIESNKILIKLNSINLSLNLIVEILFHLLEVCPHFFHVF